MIKTGFSPHVEISLDNLIHNINQIKSVVPPSTGILAVVKDNSYGCGSIPIAKALEQHGNVKFFAVARVEEAFALIKSGIEGTILVLGRATSDQIDKASTHNIVFTINDLDDFDTWAQCHQNIRFHCIIDTAMHRMGLLPHEMPALIKKISSSTKFQLEGVFTHLSKADEPDTPTVATQRTIFFSCIQQLRENGIHPHHIHYGNSAGLMCFPMDECTLVRPGIAIYGCKPDPNRKFCLNLHPILSLKSVVAKIKKVPAGTPVSYGGNYITKSETFIATIAIGYAHGLPRFLGNKGSVLVNGKRYSIAGNVTMDYVMIDAGSEPKMKVGDEAVAIGAQGNEQITADEIAKIGNTISYEILCHISTAIERFYLFEDKIVLHEEYRVY
jgi:alanine racemase